MNPKAILAVCGGYGAGGWFFFQILRRWRLMQKARFWVSVTGEIIESVTYRDPDRQGTHFRVRYRFTVGEPIDGNTPRLSGDWFWNKKRQQEFVDRYLPGQKVEVFYDSRDPKQNCLDRDDKSGFLPMWIIAIGGPILASLILWLKP